MKEFLILKTKSSRDYELLDSGEREKLERYGDIILSRPDTQALWQKHLSIKEWQKAKAVFSHAKSTPGWKINLNVPKKWKIELNNLNFWIKPTPFKHTGIFPEQIDNWNWIQETIKKSNREISILNLFGYTGGATLAAAQAGARVCHVDGSKSAITWARENAEISGLSQKPIRWILDDARKFLKREIKRKNFYNGIIMDPPIFGHGPKGELWRIENDFLGLIDLCKLVISEKPVFFLINGYASGYSAIAYENNLKNILEKYGGEIETGELTIEESDSSRLLPCGIFSRWRKI